MLQDQMILKMVDFYQGDGQSIPHFMKVYAFAALIGRLEGLDEDTQNTLEMAAIIHDIACPLCQEKYGSARGDLQEAESEPLVRAFLQEYKLPEDRVNRLVFLVCHHHTYEGVDGPDYQILLEADYLVNAGESEWARKDLARFRQDIFKTQAGIRLLSSMFPAA